MTDATPEVSLAELNHTPGWKYRRMAVFIVLGFFMTIIAWVTFTGQDTETARINIMSAVGVITVILSGYLGVAAVDDNNTGKLKANVLIARNQQMAELMKAGAVPSSNGAVSYSRESGRDPSES